MDYYNLTTSKPVDIIDKISSEGELKKLYDRIIFYEDKITSGEMTTIHAKNSIKKMIRDEKRE